MNPVINLANMYKIFFNMQTVTVTQPNGVSWENVTALMRVVDTYMATLGDGTEGQRTVTHWIFFKTDVPDNLIPQINTILTDQNGTDWYVGDVENMYFGNVFKMTCESGAGVGVQNEQNPRLPSNTTTTSSSSTAGP